MTGANFTLFFVAGLFALLGAVITVIAKNPLRAAMGLLMNIIALAGLYLTLAAELLAAIQLIVYAGAVVVLFVFVIMLIGPAAEAKHGPGSVLPRLASLVLMTMVTGTVAFSVVHVSARWVAYPEGFGGVAAVGTELYTKALLPFEIVSITLLVAIVGAIAIARKRTVEETLGAAQVREAVVEQAEERAAAAALADALPNRASLSDAAE